MCSTELQRIFIGSLAKKYAPRYSVKALMKNEVTCDEVLNIPLYLISGLELFIV